MAAPPVIDTLWRGRPYPRGATWDGMGVNFALFSESAERVELCLFDASGRNEVARIALREQTDQVFHGYLPQARPGLLYGYRVHGPYRPQDGHRFNGHKLLLDPYARNIVGTIRWHDALFGYRVGHAQGDLSFDRRDSAPYLPRCKVVESAFTWGDDRPPNVPWHETVIYELHVRGFTRQHPGVPPALRGTYAGLACAPVVDHLKRLGVTTVELMPVHAFVDDRHLVERGLRNYWGYNTIGFFAPEHRYSASRQGRRVQDHGAHAARGGHRGDPRRGLQPHRRRQRARADAVVPRHRQCRLLPPRARQPALLPGLHRLRQHPQHAAPARAADGDGFAALLGHRDARRRLPLRPGLGAGPRAARGRPARRVLRHPAPGPGAVARQAHRRAVGPRRGRLPGGQLPGRLGRVERPVPRHDARLLEGRRRRDRRVRAAPDRLQRPLRPQQPPALREHQLRHRARRLHAADLVSYNDKHNEANGEDNRDGHNNNLSWNCGAEGPTDDADDPRAARAPAAQLPRHAAAVAGRADAARRRRVRPHPGAATTTPTARTTRSAGSTGRRATDRRTAARVHAAADRRCAPRTRCSGAATSSRAGRCTAAQSATSSGFSPTAPR